MQVTYKLDFFHLLAICQNTAFHQVTKMKTLTGHILRRVHQIVTVYKDHLTTTAQSFGKLCLVAAKRLEQPNKRVVPQTFRHGREKV
jgi:hypothetical protein